MTHGKAQNRLQSTLGRSRSGRLILSVPYSGRGWERAIQRAMREHGLSDRDDVTVIAVPEGMI